MATVKTIGQLEAELRKLAETAQTNLYKRLEVASQMLESQDFLDTFEGSIDRAHDHIRSRFFTERSTSEISFGRLLDMRKRLGKKTWSEYHGDLSALQQLYLQMTGQADETLLKGNRTSWKAECEKREEEIRRLAAENARLAEELQQVKEHRDDLKRDKQEMGGRIDEMARIIDKHLQVA